MAKMAVFPSPTKPCVDTKGQQRRRPLQNKGGEMQSRASHRSLIFSLILESCRLSSLHSVLSTQRSALSHRDLPGSRGATYAYQTLQKTDVVSGAR